MLKPGFCLSAIKIDAQLDNVIWIQGPLIAVAGFDVSMIRFCWAHNVNLGVLQRSNGSMMFLAVCQVCTAFVDRYVLCCLFFVCGYHAMSSFGHCDLYKYASEAGAVRGRILW